MIRVVIADDHYLIRAGFRQLAADAGDVEIVGEAPDGGSLLILLEQVQCDIAIVDVGMPGPGFVPLLDAIRRRFPDVRTLVVSVEAGGELAMEALRAGAAGYVSKAQAVTDLLSAVRRIHAGGRYVSATLAERLAGAPATGPPALPHEALSTREHQVLCLLGAGRSNNEIAATLSVGSKSVSTYRARVLHKLSLKTNADIVRYVLEHRLIG